MYFLELKRPREQRETRKVNQGTLVCDSNLKSALPEISDGHKLSPNSRSEMRSTCVQHILVSAVDDFPSSAEDT